MPDLVRVGLERWTRDTDETFQECALDDINDCIRTVAKAKGPKQQTFTLYLGPRIVEITFRRVR